MLLDKHQAFVLSTSDYGESDRIVSLFTLEQGRIRGFARAARNSRKRFGAALEAFARIELQLVRKEGLSSLKQADVITLHNGIRGDLGCIAHALYACELVDCLTPEGQPLPRLYRLMAAYLERLDCGCSDESDRRMFEMNLLNILGYRPELEQCSRCGVLYNEQPATILAGAELACRFCARTGKVVDAPARKKLLACLATGRFGSLAFTSEELSQAGQLLEDAISVHAGRKLKSLDFLQQSA